MRRRDDFQPYLRGQNCFVNEKSSYFVVTIVAINQISLKRFLDIFQAVFMLKNLNIIAEMLGNLPVVFVAQKASKFDKMPVKFPAVFVAKKASGSKHDVFLTVWLLCQNLTRI